MRIDSKENSPTLSSSHPMGLTPHIMNGRHIISLTDFNQEKMNVTAGIIKHSIQPTFPEEAFLDEEDILFKAEPILHTSVIPLFNKADSSLEELIEEIRSQAQAKFLEKKEESPIDFIAHLASLFKTLRGDQQGAQLQKMIDHAVEKKIFESEEEGFSPDELFFIEGDSITCLNEIEDIKSQDPSHYKLGMKIGNLTFIDAENEEEAQRIESADSRFIAFIAPSSLKPQINLIINKSIENYITYTLNSEEKEREEKTHTRKPSTSYSLSQTTTSEPTYQNELTNRNRFYANPEALKRISTITSIVALIVEESQEEKKEQSDIDKKDAIKRSELQREIDKEEIKKNELNLLRFKV